MILQYDDWVFDVDIQKRESISDAEVSEHCNCGYCRNFYAGIDSAYPNLRGFFADFGVNIEASDELMPYEEGNEVHYYGVVSVCGRIVSNGTKPLVVDDIQIEPSARNVYNINTVCPDPCFYLAFSDLVLNWSLDEPMDSVESDAKDPVFMSRIWDRIFGKSSSDDLPS